MFRAKHPFQVETMRRGKWELGIVGGGLEEFVNHFDRAMVPHDLNYRPYNKIIQQVLS